MTTAWRRRTCMSWASSQASSMDIEAILELESHAERRAEDHLSNRFSKQFKERRGDACADFAAKQLPANLLAAYRARAKEVVKMSAEKEAALIAEALAESFEVTDKAWLQMAKKKDLPDGSTGGRLRRYMIIMTYNIINM